MRKYSSKIIVGYFNSDPCSNKAEAQFVNSVIEENALYAIPYGRTYHREDVDSTLDRCFIDAEDIVINFWKRDVPFSEGHN